MTRNGPIAGAVAAAALLLLGGTAVFRYNRLVALDQSVRESWAQVENVLQRRSDLIPNLVAAVKGYAKHEKEVFTEVTAARAAAGSARTFAEKAAAAGDLDRALGRLLLVVESYPQLKASESFLRLQDELAGAENRIAVERKRFNETTAAYNRAARSFPTVLFVRVLGFDARKPFFEASQGADAPPAVSF